MNFLSRFFTVRTLVLYKFNTKMEKCGGKPLLNIITGLMEMTDGNFCRTLQIYKIKNK